MATFSWQGDLPRAARLTLASKGWEPGRTGPRVVHTARPELPAHRGPFIWLVDGRPSPPVLHAAVDAGALDVICTADRHWELRLLARLQETLVSDPPLPVVKDFVAESAAAKALLRNLQLAARTSMPVLLTGETGTGKELAARFVHQWSARHARAFVPINCSAIPNELMEGELFGYVRGAFSGAMRDYDGQLGAAEGGTVFLDEIDDTPIALQNKLLRVLEDRVVSRLGENTWRRVDFRLVAATNRELKGLIARGAFGADLFERLSTLQVVLPTLRERLDDLPALVSQLINRFYVDDPLAAKRLRVHECTPEVLDVLRGYPWPGNIRELRNVIFGALVAKRAGQQLLVSDLPRRLWSRAGAEEDGLEARIASGQFNLRLEREALERRALTAALRRANGNAAQAARLLGEVGRGSARDPGGTVRTMMRRLGFTSGA